MATPVEGSFEFRVAGFELKPIPDHPPLPCEGFPERHAKVFREAFEFLQIIEASDEQVKNV
jgi:hypothetical protein